MRLITSRAATFISVVLIFGASARATESADVVVYGGTAAGVMASVAAAREGASVVLVTPGRHLGGMVSGGLGWTDYGRTETVGGYTREYYERVGKAYGKRGVEWHVEPHVAEAVFEAMAREAGVRIVRDARLKEQGGVRLVGTHAVAIVMENGEEFAGKVFIDAGYEGDLMAQAKVSWRAGREARSEYDEPGAGVRRLHPSSQPGAAVDEHGVLPIVYAGA